MGTFGDGLDNYRRLVFQIDRRCAEIVAGHGQNMVCRKGCSDCCRHISVFAVEALVLARALARLPRGEIAVIRRRAASAAKEGACPLLADDGACLLYDDRPVICRTHGLPIIFEREGERRVDFCPNNFKGISTLPGDAALFLDRINETLSAVNRLFTEGFLPEVSPLSRFTVAEALLMDMEWECQAI